MAYRRKHGTPKAATFEDFRPGGGGDDESPATPSLAAQAIRASSAHRDSSLSSAYGESAIASAYRDPDRQRPSPSPSPRSSTTYEYTSMKSLSESKTEGFWGVLARRAKSILDDDNAVQQLRTSHQNQPQMLNTPTSGQFNQSYQLPESHRKADNPAIPKGLGALTSSLNHIGGAIGNALEEGLTIVEHRTADIIQETKKLNIRRKSSGSNAQNDSANPSGLSQIQADHETQLKASRDVANAMAAKAKLLLRELKTVKADLAFSKERCAQLEEENKVLRESRDKGDHPEDDDLIRLQLETLLAEKARLANENSIYARENRFLREIVEYHQLTMQDVVYLDEGIEEVTEVYQIPIAPARAVGEAQFFIPASPSSMSEPSSLPIPVPPSSVLNSSVSHDLASFEPEAFSVISTPASPGVVGVEVHPSQMKDGQNLIRQT
uniref:Initiation-control protein yabA n=1 Tax=Anthurium amnicola TaxID=1678845 RepID=A0A1D1YXI8_9ARAE